MNEGRSRLSEFLKRQTYCTFVTVDRVGAPEGATVSFSEAEDGSFLIGTSIRSYKAGNVRRNRKVALVVSDTVSFETALIKGEAEILPRSEYHLYEGGHYEKTPDSLPFRDDPDEVMIVIKPYFIKFSNVGVDPWQVVEYGDSLVDGLL